MQQTSSPPDPPLARHDPDTLHGLIEQVAEQHPRAVALSDGNREISYAELIGRARGAATRLRAVGCRGPDAIVGLLGEPSIELFIALLGVVEAGAAFLGLDPRPPDEHLQMLIGDARPAAVIADGPNAGRPCLEGCQVVPLHDALGGGAARGRPSDQAPLSAAGGQAAPSSAAVDRPIRSAADDLAYVVYTSGSTGRPKGVMIEHRGVLNLVRGLRRALDIGPGDRVTQFHSLSFDASMWELAMALTAGATLVIVPPELRLPGPELLAFVAAQRVTVLGLSPSALAALPWASLPDVRIVMSGGEQCTPALVSRWAPGRRYVNSYGPSEASVCATVADCAADGGQPRSGARSVTRPSAWPPPTCPRSLTGRSARSSSAAPAWPVATWATRRSPASASSTIPPRRVSGATAAGTWPTPDRTGSSCTSAGWTIR